MTAPRRTGIVVPAAGKRSASVDAPPWLALAGVAHYHRAQTAITTETAQQ
jgi:hypothetical protein